MIDYNNMGDFDENKSYSGFIWKTFNMDDFIWKYEKGIFSIKKTRNNYKSNSCDFTWLLLNVLKTKGFKPVKAEKDINYAGSHILISRIFNFFSKNGEKEIEISKEDLFLHVKDINFFYKQRDENLKKPILDYIVGISKPIIYGDCIHIDVTLLSSITPQEIQKWYPDNKSYILKKIEEKCKGKIKESLNFYKLGAVTLISGGILRVVLEPKIDL